MTVTAQYNSQQLIAPNPGANAAGLGGSVLYAPAHTPLPTSTAAVLNSAFTDLGYVDEKGITDKEDRKNHDVFAWGGDLVGTLQDSYSRTMEITFMQYLDSNVLSVVYGKNNVVVTPSTVSSGTEVAIALNSILLDTLSWVFQGFYQNALVCKTVPLARIVNVGDVNWTNKNFTTVTATLKAFPDANKNHGYLYTDDGRFSGAS